MAGSINGEGVFVDEHSYVDITCTDIHGNEGGDWVFPLEELLGQEGNICEDPLFCDAANGDFSLAEGSPCLPGFNPDCGVMGAHGLGCSAPAAGPATEILAGGLGLVSNYPNPFNPTTTIHFDLLSAQQTSLTIYRVDGRRVVTLVDGFSPAGRQEVVWHGTDEHGRQVPSGIYYTRLEAGKYTRTIPMALIR